LINLIFAGLLFVQLWLLTASWSESHAFGLFYWLQLPRTVRLILAIVLLDLWTYSWHWINHHVDFLWRFHRTHHTELTMDVTSAVRFHFGEIVFSGFLRVPLILLLGLQFEELVIYEMLLFAVVQFHHANIILPARVESFLRWFIVTPGFHRIHHSPEVALANTNFSSFLSVWDRIFRTLSPISFTAKSSSVMGEQNQRLFGVRGMESPAHHNLIGLVETPLE